MKFLVLLKTVCKEFISLAGTRHASSRARLQIQLRHADFVTGPNPPWVSVANRLPLGSLRLHFKAPQKAGSGGKMKATNPENAPTWSLPSSRCHTVITLNCLRSFSLLPQPWPPGGQSGSSLQTERLVMEAKHESALLAGSDADARLRFPDLWLTSLHSPPLNLKPSPTFFFFFLRKCFAGRARTGLNILALKIMMSSLCYCPSLSRPLYKFISARTN